MPETGEQDRALRHETLLPPQPRQVDEATTLDELLDDGLARFAMTFDGYAHFGERWSETLAARREEWERSGTLPRDVEALRGLLFLAYRQERFLTLDDTARVHDGDGALIHEPNPALITEARREQERFKHALLSRMRTLTEADDTDR